MTIRHPDPFPEGASPDSISWKHWNADHDVAAGSITGEMIDPSIAPPLVVVKRESDLELVHVLVLTPDPELTFDIGANETWFFRARLISDAILSKLNVGLSVPSGATAEWGYEGGSQVTHDENDTFSEAIDKATPDTITTLCGYVYNGATAGSVGLTFAQHDDAACRCSIKVQSFLEARRLE